MTRTLILPGYMGSGPDHWQQHWLNDNPGSEFVEQDDWERPDLDTWLARLEDRLDVSEDVILVAHSLGCLLAARLAGRASAEKIRGALLVAPCHLDRTEQLHPDAIDFGEMPEKRLPFPSLLIGSLNDPYMPFEQCRRYASLWGSDLIDLGYAGHINVASGFGRWTNGYGFLSLFKRNRPAGFAGRLPEMASHRAFRGLVRDRRLLP
ncbi:MULTISPECIES: RBBP9/YdeN family alpha/beta hydrolase [unclassified Rhizobium]|uniref:RBBP9/YdeN family alpha/beta hydrolase n=1 Tax=unclassified Rhizobium TaxID=2613769 RepID=UPI000787472C|nr:MULTISPECIES: alpha/beta hydrolase [unclassified Rhizobium]